MIEKVFNFHSAKIALYDSVSRTALSYEDIQQQINHLGYSLNEYPEGLIFCFCKNNIGSLLCYLTALATRHPIALLDTNLDVEAKAKLVALYSPEFILESQTTNPRHVAFTGYREDELKINDGTTLRILIRQSTLNTALHPDLALLLPTSGTTGSAKLVRLSYQNLRANADSIIRALEITGSEIAVTSLPIHYSYGLSVVNTHLRAEAGIVVCEPDLLTDNFWKVVRDYRCTAFAGVPYAYEILNKLDINRLSVPDLAKFTQAGGKLNNGLIETFAKVISERGGNFYVMYGQTEATARISVMPAQKLRDKISSVGLAIPGGVLQVSRENNLTQAAHCQGEIVYTGPNVMMGYAENRADLSSGDLTGGMLYTGDIGYLDEEQFLYITGRLKRFSKILGYRINLDEIESAITHLRAAAIVGKDERICIYCENGDQSSFASAKKSLAEKLHINQTVFNFTKIDKLPLTASGKIDYKQLQKDLNGTI